MGSTSNASQSFSIVKGSDIDIVIGVQPKGKCEPYDLTSLDTATVSFPNQGSGYLLKDNAGIGGVTIIDAIRGKIKVTLSDADTDLLKLGRRQDIEIKLDFGTRTRKFKWIGILDVIKSQT